MTDIRDLNSAVQNATFPSAEFAAAVREWIAAATERMEGGREVCPNCGRDTNGNTHIERWGSSRYVCQKSEMPETADFHNDLWEAMGYPKLDVREISVSEAIVRKAIDAIKAQPAPPSEMPEAVRDAVNSLRACASTAKFPCILHERADALESWWRSQPAPAIRMTEELEMVLRSAALAATREAPMEAAIVRSSIAAVREQYGRKG